MKGKRIRYQQTGEFHFLTFSCYRRRSYLEPVAAVNPSRNYGGSGGLQAPEKSPLPELSS
jgi:hypothetical protein